MFIVTNKQVHMQPGGKASTRKRGHWSIEEDIRLLQAVKKYGEGRWSRLAKTAGLQRCGKSCRLRWVNYLRPDVKRGHISEEEERLIIQLHAALGNKWSLIAIHLPGRSDNEIKNYWRSHIQKKLRRIAESVNNINEKDSIQAESSSMEAGNKSYERANLFENCSDGISTVHTAPFEEGSVIWPAEMGGEYEVDLIHHAGCSTLSPPSNGCTIVASASQPVRPLPLLDSAAQQRCTGCASATSVNSFKTISDCSHTWIKTCNGIFPPHIVCEPQDAAAAAATTTLQERARIFIDGDFVWDVESFQTIADSNGTQVIPDMSELWMGDVFGS